MYNLLKNKTETDAQDRHPVIITNKLLNLLGYHPYIRTGLCMWLDGKYDAPHGYDIIYGTSKPTRTNADKWIDLISGAVFLRNNDIPKRKSNGWYFDGSSNCYLYNPDTLNIPYTTCTIEVCYTPMSSNDRGMIFISKTNNDVCFGYFNNTKVCCAVASASVANATHTFHNALNNKQITCSVNVSTALANMTDTRTAIANDYWGAGTYNTIGGRTSGTTSFTGIIHCIRIYNRQLTVDEMRYNQNVDKLRFDLNI